MEGLRLSHLSPESSKLAYMDMKHHKKKCLHVSGTAFFFSSELVKEMFRTIARGYRKHII